MQWTLLQRAILLVELPVCPSAITTGILKESSISDSDVTSPAARTAHRNEQGAIGAATGTTLPTVVLAHASTTERCDELVPEVAAAQAVYEEVDGRVQGDDDVADYRQCGARRNEVGHPREATVQRPEDVRDGRYQIASNAHQNDDDDNESDAFLGRHYLVRGLMDLRQRRPKRAGSPQLT